MDLREAARREIDRRLAEGELCRRSFAEFVRRAWPTLHPGRALEWAWYLDAICLHLEAVARGDGSVRRLLITQPPNTLKSTVTAVCWPAWVWAWAPQTRFLYAANDGPLATRDAVAMRDLVKSDWYQDLFAPAWRLKADKDEKTWFANTAGGHRISYSVNAKVTGKKGDVLVVDDADDAKKVHSAAERKAVHDWHDQAFSGRMIDERSSPEVVVGQRLHRDDLIGHLKRRGGFAELRLDEEFDPAARCVTPLWSDPRDYPGELLRPTRFGPPEVADAKKRLGPRGYKAQHRQSPDDEDGSVYKADWLSRRWRWVRTETQRLIDLAGYRFDPDARVRFGTADPAATSTEAADYTAVSSWVTSPRGDLVWLGCRRERLEIPDQPAAVKAEWDRHGLSAVAVEAVANQQSLYQHCQRLGLAVVPVSPKGRDKLARSTAALVLAQTGRLWLPDEGQVSGFPLYEVVEELLAFTGSGDDDHDDVADTLGMAGELMPAYCGAGNGPTVVPRPADPPAGRPGGTDWAGRRGLYGMG